MFPVSPGVGRTNITSSNTTSRRAQFRDDVAERDGRTCVLTGLETGFCDAVHLVPHSKGDRVCYFHSESALAHDLQYIATYTERRSRDPACGDYIQGIDSIYNGLSLNKLTHTKLGIDVAFLMVCATTLM